MNTIIEGFNCLEMKRKIQAKIYADTKDMTAEERLKHTEQAAARFDEEMRQLKEKEKLATQKKVKHSL